jgi:hypothetical protein
MSTPDLAVPMNGTTAAPPLLMLPVDAEHGGIRMAGCLSFIVTTLVSYFVLSLLIQDSLGIGLVLIASLLLGAGMAYGLDRQLKKTWPSGRALTVTDQAILLTKHNQPETTLNPHQQVNVLAWRFEVKRNGRVKKGWYVIGLALEQEDSYIPVYTFAPPERFQSLPWAHHFETLQRPSSVEDQKASARELKLAGLQRRLYTAEKMRQQQGAEVTFEQFEQWVAFLQEQYPSWMLT